MNQQLGNLTQTLRVWKDGKEINIPREKLIDKAIQPELNTVINGVLNKDRDWVTVVDGED